MPGETFEQQRLRVDRQEAPLFQQPSSSSRQRSRSPPPRPTTVPAPSTDDHDLADAVFPVDEFDLSALPPGWTQDGEGYLQFTGHTDDYWTAPSTPRISVVSESPYGVYLMVVSVVRPMIGVMVAVTSGPTPRFPRTGTASPFSP